MKLGLLAGASVLSFSPLYFRRIYGLTYEKYTPNQLSTLKEEIAQKKWTGFNVTTPYKEAILSLLDELHSEAAAIRAVNVVSILPDRRWIGYNTDSTAARYILSEMSEVYPPWDKVVILGTGGAARAVAHAHYELFPLMPIVFISRQRNKVLPFPASCQVISYEECEAFDWPDRVLLVQATPEGMFPEVLRLPPFPIHLIQKGWVVWDLIYNPNPTLFLRKARAQGASIESGIQLFRKQAEHALELWSQDWVSHYKRR
ncbi:MAG: shikimate dehydrogenase [Bacteroidia bacterium]|nr:shikimate dehydrogenase [Bacteroidia bacterium]